MPYMLEKGPALRILERQINGDGHRAAMQQRLVRLRANINDPEAWLTGTGRVWKDPGFAKDPDKYPAPAPPGQAARERILTEWFGYTPRTGGGFDPPPPGGDRTGYWIGYKGNVAGIVGEALAWAMELALANGGATAVPPLDPWPIELFWKCPANWFEAWVIARRDPGRSSGRITLVFMTPSHDHGVVALSPIAKDAVASPPGSLHPVPSWEDDYEQLHAPFPGTQAHRPQIKPATARSQAMWVVSESDHEFVVDEIPVPRRQITSSDRARQTNTVGPWVPGDFEPAQLSRYAGSGDVVVVSPSMASGGIKHDGEV